MTTDDKIQIVAEILRDICARQSLRTRERCEVEYYRTQADRLHPIASEGLPPATKLETEAFLASRTLFPAMRFATFENFLRFWRDKCPSPDLVSGVPKTDNTNLAGRPESHMILDFHIAIGDNVGCLSHAGAVEHVRQLSERAVQAEAENAKLRAEVANWEALAVNQGNEAAGWRGMADHLNRKITKAIEALNYKTNPTPQ